jgi:hypothetical protein
LFDFGSLRSLDWLLLLFFELALAVGHNCCSVETGPRRFEGEPAAVGLYDIQSSVSTINCEEVEWQRINGIFLLRNP